jgi:hypothetical protein
MHHRTKEGLVELNSIQPNSTMSIVRYFQSNEKPVDYEEFNEFWDSLTSEEMYYYFYVDLETGLPKKPKLPPKPVLPKNPFIGAMTRAQGVRDL